jgi:glycosyltransferase involved in cell wall biosynthesis
VLREVGGTGAVYCPPGDENAWTDTTLRLLEERNNEQRWIHRRQAAQRASAQFSWETNARATANIYASLQ